MRLTPVVLSLAILCAFGGGPVRTQEGPRRAELRAVATTPIIGILRDSNTRVGPPRGQAALHAEATATFVVNYTGFTPQAQAAFQAAVDVWANLVSSPVPIAIDAQFAALGNGVLGSAGATFVVRDFTGAPQSGTWYPVALANARAGSDLIPTDSDIDASFSSAVPNWYFGTDGNTPAGQFDFMTVVLHELGHGLGFFGSANVSGGLGSWGLTSGGTFPFTYDRLAVNGVGQHIIDTALFSNPSAALAAQLTSGGIYWNGAAGLAASGGAAPRLYAPPAWSGGSSYSHLNDDTYPAGNPNSLMTPFIGTAESIHAPGPIALGMFTDIGWTANAPPQCAYTLGYTSIGVAAAGTSGATLSVTTTPGCAWTAVSNNAGFITITGGAAGTGSGVVTYNVSANSGPFRSGTMTVAGQLVTIGQTGVGPVLMPDRISLRFGATSTGAAFAAQTGPQPVRLIQSGSGNVTWTATPSQPWLRVTPAVGTGSATLSVSIVGTPGLPASGTSLGTIALTAVGASNAPIPIAVTLTTILTGTSASPFGFVDTPTDNRTGVTGAVPFTGWSLDDLEVAGVAICRQPFGSEVAPPSSQCGGAAQLLVGSATFIDGARPDIVSAYPLYPMSSRGGWGFMLLTNMLPNQGNGTYTFSMWAQDREGHSALLGTRTMTCDNVHATLPFGAIDTPAQGGLAAGAAFVNFGWALTPQPKTIPINGSTIAVLVDGVPVGTADYNHFRSDIAGLFPGRNNSDGAVGFRILNTTGLTDGVHTISWVVTDNQGATEGIGSRFFTVSNAVPALGAATVEQITGVRPDRVPSVARRDMSAIQGRRGWNLTTPLGAFVADQAGRVVVRVEEVGRVELLLEPGSAGYLRAGNSIGPLPIGSHLDETTGVFTWAPGVGFVGAYDFVFARRAGGGVVARRDVRIILQPKGSGAVGPQVVIDTPAPQQDVPQPFVVSGWAADLDAAAGTGISTLHAWAYPLAGGPPVFLGTTEYGGARPDVGAAQGDQFVESGFSLVVQGLPHGNYDLAVFAWSDAKADFLPARVVRITVR